MDEFYKKAKGLMILVIRHNGTTFDYVNGYKNNQYFASWKPVLPFMEPGGYYSIACLVKENNGRAKLQPFGILNELVDEKAAKDLSFAIKSMVEKGHWKGTEVIAELQQECVNFILDWAAEKMNAVQMLPGYENK